MTEFDVLHRPAYQADLLVTALRRSRNRPALVVGDQELTGGELAARISSHAQALTALGMTPGRSVALLSPNRPEVLVQTGAAMVNALRATPLGIANSLDEMAFVINDAEIEFLVYDPVFEERAVGLKERRPDLQLVSLGPSEHGTDVLAEAERHEPTALQPQIQPPDAPSSIVYTGGTTGRPKGVVGSYRSGGMLNHIAMAEWQWPQRPRFLMCTPLTHAGAAFFVPTLLNGGTLVVLKAFDPEAVFQAVEEHRITALMLVPTMIYKLLDHPDIDKYDLSSLERIYYTASAMNPSRLQQAIDRFGQIFVQLYGQTECGMTISVLRAEDHDRDDLQRLASCGRPVPWLDVRLLDDDLQEVEPGEVGEICVRGPLVMSGYWNRPEETAEALRGDWLHTGDLARMDDDGFMFIVDRAKDMIVSGGFNVYPREVEDVIATHPGVAQVAVIGVPHPTWGEAVTAVVVPRPGAAIDTDEITALVREAKGAVQTPKSIELVDSLPMTPLGKLDKKALRAERWAGRDRRV